MTNVPCHGIAEGPLRRCCIHRQWLGLSSQWFLQVQQTERRQHSTCLSLPLRPVTKDRTSPEIDVLCQPRLPPEEMASTSFSYSAEE
jgi:hypothetical protein